MSLDMPSNGETGDQIEVATSPEQTGHTGNRGLFVGIGAVAIVLVIGAAAFGLRALMGTGLESLQAIPSDADVVISMDFMQLRDSEQVDALIQTFAQPMEEAGYVEFTDIDPFEELNEALEDELGWNLEEDVIPWLGRSVSAGAWIPADVEASDAYDAIISIAVRDRAAAENFLDDNADPDVVKTEFENGHLYTGDDEDVFSIWLGQQHMLMATSRSTIRSGIDAIAGESVLDNQTFNRLVDELPPERLAMFYVGQGVFESLSAASVDLLPTQQMGVVEDYQGAAFSVDIEDDGVRFDLVQLLEGQAAAEAAAANEVAGVSQLPGDTIGYVSFDIPDGTVEEALEQFRQADPMTYDDMAEQAKSELGVDLFGDVLPSIAGESLFAAISTRDGALAEETGVPIGLLLSLGLSDPGPMEAALISLENLAVDEDVIIQPGSPRVAYVDGLELLAYDVTSDALVVGSAESLLSEFADGSGGLTDGALYQELDASLPGNGLMFYLDLGRMFDLFELDPADRKIVDPVRGVGASSSFDGEVLTSSMMILIEYADAATP